MIKTSVVRQVSVDDVRQIPHLTAVGMMTVDVFGRMDKFDYFDREDFVELLNDYTMHCNLDDNSMEYFVTGRPHKRVIFMPAGLDGIKIEYHLGHSKRVSTWSYDDYAELADDWGNDEDDEGWYK